MVAVLALMASVVSARKASSMCTFVFKVRWTPRQGLLGVDGVLNHPCSVRQLPCAELSPALLRPSPFVTQCSRSNHAPVTPTTLM